MVRVTGSIARSVPAVLPELAKLGRALNNLRLDILAFFDHPRTSNDPTEAINGRVENLRGTAVDFRNLTNYITRNLLEEGEFKPQPHPLMGRASLLK